MGVIAVILLAGLLGPLLATWRRLPLPIVIGEILGGVLVGPQVLGLVNPDDQIVRLLHDTGFALLMFTVGLHLRLHDPALRKAMPRASIACAVTAVFAFPIAWILAEISNVQNVGAIAVVLATSSAAIALPVLSDSTGKDLPPQLAGLAAWIVIADVATIVALPLVTAQSSIWTVLFASLAVTIIALLALVILRFISKSRFYLRVAELSKEKGWGLEMRIALILLFALAWVGPQLGTSMLVAGFAAGLAVSAFGVSSRLTTQLVGIGEGFLIPAFFVVLGTELDPGGLFEFDSLVLLVGLVVGTVIVHLVGGAAAGYRPAYGLIASAQMGVPLALVTLGRGEGWFAGGEASAFVVAAMISVGISAIGAHRVGKSLQLRLGVPQDLKTVE